MTGTHWAGWAAGLAGWLAGGLPWFLQRPPIGLHAAGGTANQEGAPPKKSGKVRRASDR